jgi:ABC-type transport system involved in multi-copper enzyme maturation permease subunit
VPRGSRSFSARIGQAWTIARIELRRAFFAKRALWIYALALLPALIFFAHGVDAKTDIARYGRGGLTDPALLNTIQKGETLDAVKARLGNPAADRGGVGVRRVRNRADNSGTTTHVIEPAREARFVRLNISRAVYSGDGIARIYEFEIYGADPRQNLALGRPATGSEPCRPDRGPEKAVNGSVAGGKSDSWCAEDWPYFLQVDLGTPRPVTRFVVKHASAGGESEDADTRDFNIQVSTDGKTYTTVATSSGAAFVDERTEYRSVTYFDGRRAARLQFVDGKLGSMTLQPVLDFEEDRLIFAGIFQYFYVRLAIFFGCLGMFMYLFSGEMSNRTLHYWFLAPAPREVLLAGKYAAGLIASAAIFGGGALLAFAAMIWPHDPVELQAYWNAGGMTHAFWYAAAAAFGCVGYGSVFLAVGLYVRNPIIPAAVLLAWEGAAGILPHVLQKISILYYLQSLCPVPAPMDDDAPALIRLLAAPAAPASRPAAILGLLALSALVLWIASRAVRRMQISYGAET